MGGVTVVVEVTLVGARVILVLLPAFLVVEAHVVSSVFIKSAVLLVVVHIPVRALNSFWRHIGIIVSSVICSIVIIVATPVGAAAAVRGPVLRVLGMLRVLTVVGVMSTVAFLILIRIVVLMSSITSFGTLVGTPLFLILVMLP